MDEREGKGGEGKGGGGKGREREGRGREQDEFKITLKNSLNVLSHMHDRMYYQEFNL